MGGDLPKIHRGRRRGFFYQLILNGVVQSVVAVAIALTSKHIFDQMIGATAVSPDRESVWPAGVFLVCLAVSGGLLRWHAVLSAEKLGQSYVHELRNQLFRHLLRLGHEGQQRTNTGAIMLRFSGDLTAVRNWISQGLARLVVNGLTAGIAITALLFLEPIVAVSVMLAAVIAATCSRALGAPLRAALVKTRRNRGKLAGYVNDRLLNASVVEAFGQFKRERRILRRMSNKVRHSMVERASIVGLMRGLIEASAGIATFGVILIGGILVNAGYTTPGGIVAAMLISGILAPRFTELGRVYEYWKTYQVAKTKQLELLALKPSHRPLKSGRVKLKFPRGVLQIINVSAAPLFKNLDFALQPGGKLALTGPNGCGKSTLLNIIAGIREPHDGKIKLGGQDLMDVRWQDRRKHFALVSPQLPLLRGSLRLNLTYGAEDVDDATISRVLDVCGLSSWSSQLPNGLDTQLRANGSNLSTGQSSRLQLARALIVNPSVLLLDEADANLDQESRSLLDDITNTFAGIVVTVTHDSKRLGANFDRLELGSYAIANRMAVTDDNDANNRQCASFTPPKLQLVTKNK